MTATLRNLTDTPVTVDGKTLTAAAQPLGCNDALPVPAADCYFLVPACLAGVALTRRDFVWSAAVPHCSRCAPAPSQRGWFTMLSGRPANIPTLRTLELYSPEEGRQSVGTEFFCRRYLD